MRRRRRVLLALQASADRRLADIRRCSRVIVDNLHVAGDLAKIRRAGCRIVGTLEITADHDAGTGKPAVSGAALNHTSPCTVTAPSRSAETLPRSPMGTVARR